MEISPRNYESYGLLGRLYADQKREDDAINAFRKQIEIAPRDVYAHDYLANAYYRKRQFDQGIAEANTATQLSPDAAALWYRLGYIQIKASRIDDARKSFAKALSLPHETMLENDIAYNMAESRLDLEKDWQLISGALNPAARQACEPTALSVEEKCAAEILQLGHMLDTAGWILYRQGKLAEAGPYLTSAYAITGGAATAFHLTALLARLGKTEDALHNFVNAVERSKITTPDSSEARAELAKIVGGEDPLKAALNRLAVPNASNQTARLRALVDGTGKAIQVEADSPDTPEALLTYAQSVSLLPISWQNFSLRTVRTIEFYRKDGGWVVDKSYVSPTLKQGVRGSDPLDH